MKWLFRFQEMSFFIIELFFCLSPSFLLFTPAFSLSTSIGLLIYTPISENQGLEKSRSISNLKKNLLPKIVLTFHCLNKLFLWSQNSFSLLICTLISEIQGLEKSRSISSPRKISGSANLDFFSRSPSWKKAGFIL